MSTFLVVCFSAVLTLSVISGAAITNGQLLALLKENQQDVVTTHDVIDLPGDENDEVDVAYLMEKLGVLPGNLDDAQVTMADDGIVGSANCTCENNACVCCVGKIFTLTVLSKSVSAVIHACVRVQYIPNNSDFLLTFILNGQLLYHKESSLANPPKICGKITGALTTAIVCLDIYNVDVSNKRLCTRLLGVLDFQIRSVYFSIGIGCFKLPARSYDTMVTAGTANLRGDKVFTLK